MLGVWVLSFWVCRWEVTNCYFYRSSLPDTCLSLSTGCRPGGGRWVLSVTCYRFYVGPTVMRKTWIFWPVKFSAERKPSNLISFILNTKTINNKLFIPDIPRQICTIIIIIIIARRSTPFTTRMLQNDGLLWQINQILSPSDQFVIILTKSLGKNRTVRTRMSQWSNAW